MLGNPQRKPDAAEIAAFMRQLSDQLSLTGGRASWPKFIFHTTDFENAIGILKSGILYSRDHVTSLGSIFIDSAHQEIIGQTDTFAKSCARFYFRPRTPTNFHTEGFRPNSDPEVESHGITVMFVFDALEVLTRSGTIFTDGNAAHRHSKRGSDAGFLRTIPFEMVYHDQAFPREDRDEFVRRRNAEIFVPDHLDLAEPLRFVVVRSEAELETILSRLRDLGQATYQQYRPMCRVNRRTANSADYFFRKWTFVDQVAVSEGMITISFSHEHPTPGPFDLRLIVRSVPDGTILSNRSAQTKALASVIATDLPAACSVHPFMVELRLNDRQAFRNSYDPSDSIIW